MSTSYWAQINRFYNTNIMRVSRSLFSSQDKKDYSIIGIGNLIVMTEGTSKKNLKIHKFIRVSTTDEVELVERKEINIPATDNTTSRSADLDGKKYGFELLTIKQKLVINSCRIYLIRRIESTTLTVIQQICLGQSPRFCYDESCDYNSANTKKRTSTFAYESSRNKFVLMMTVLSAAHRLLLKNVKVTRRSFYYDLKDRKMRSLARTQSSLDKCVNHVANLLNCNPWDLNFVATSKGLVAGDLIFSIANEGTIDCRISGGALISQNVSNITSITVRAKFILIVEKDTVFQKLLQHNCPTLLNCILITGKGYPDRATRTIIKILSEKTELPVYMIADADPFGVDIICVYRFGSYNLSDTSLTCPNLRWLGIFPSELPALGVRTVPLTELDLAKLTSIEGRPYATESLLKELVVMREGKAEIEGVASISRNFLAETYIPCKIKGNNYI